MSVIIVGPRTYNFLVENKHIPDSGYRINVDISEEKDELVEKLKILMEENRIMYEYFEHRGNYYDEERIYCTERYDCEKCEINEIGAKK
jgi:hypothetical protein